MPGDSTGNFSLLHRVCKLVVLLCFLHISVTVVFYVRSLDIRFAFVQNQQSNNGTQRNQLRSTGFTTRAEPKRAEMMEPRDGPQPPEQPGKQLQKCPETSPLLAAPPPPQALNRDSFVSTVSSSVSSVSSVSPSVSSSVSSVPLWTLSSSRGPVGPLRVEFNTPVSLEQIKRENPGVQVGGRSRPRDCEALQKVAIIIPFRNREEHLKYWLYYLHPILQRQQLDYGVYVINQDGQQIFNRAKLLNVGYSEALKEDDYTCFIFSDVDLIPMDDRNTYRCFSQPRHLSVSMDKFGFRLPYNQYFGGVSSMSKEQYLKINGFPNNYWGWGGEDDDIYNRLASKGMSISRPSGDTGKCRMIRHQRDKQNEPNPQRFDRIAHTRDTMLRDGINSLSYKVVKVDKSDLFTMITVDVGEP